MGTFMIIVGFLALVAGGAYLYELIKKTKESIEEKVKGRFFDVDKRLSNLDEGWFDLKMELKKHKTEMLKELVEQSEFLRVQVGDATYNLRKFQEETQQALTKLEEEAEQRREMYEKAFEGLSKKVQEVAKQEEVGRERLFRRIAEVNDERTAATKALTDMVNENLEKINEIYGIIDKHQKYIERQQQK